MTKVGIIKEMYESKKVEWRIPNFATLGICIFESPLFTFADGSWHLRIFPDTDGHELFSIYVCNKTACPCRMTYSFSIKNSEGTLIGTKKNTNYIDSTDGFYSFIKSSDLQERKFELLPSGTLTIVCELSLIQGGIRKGKRIGKTSTSNKKQAVEIVGNLKVTDERSLCNIYKKILLEGKNHDLILRIGDKELPAHRDILSARSHVFESMLSLNMKEKNTGVVDISDCDPLTMEQVLLYVYCGKVDTLDENNMLGLYYAADKYELADLKRKCCDFIKRSLSVTNVCSVIQLALNHGDSDLLECASENFCDNLPDIIRTMEWQSFFKDNFTFANELLIRSVDRLKTPKD